MRPNVKLTLIFTMLFFIFGFSVFAQETDDLDELDENPSQENVVCMPDSFNTPYEYLAAKTLSPNEVKIQFSYLSDYAKKRNWDKVKKYGWELIYGDKKRMFKSVYDKLADAYFNSNQVDTTLLVCQMGISDVGDRTRLHYYSGYIQFKLGRYACAEKDYQYLLSKSPESIEYARYLTQCLIKQDKESAIQAQEKVVELSNNDPKEQTLLAQLSEKFGYNPMDTYLNSWSSEPTKENIQTAVKITTLAVQQARETDGIKVGLEALKIEPDNEILIRNMAELYNAKMQYNDALTYYKKFLQKDDSNIDIYCAIAYIYMDMKNWKNARSYAEKAIRVNRKSGRPYIVLGTIYQTAATNCLNEKYDSKINIDIKLVYKMAYDELGKAINDPAYKVDALNKRKWLKSNDLIPNKEDLFLHPDVKEPRIPCFDWIKQ